MAQIVIRPIDSGSHSDRFLLTHISLIQHVVSCMNSVISYQFPVISSVQFISLPSICMIAVSVHAYQFSTVYQFIQAYA